GWSARCPAHEDRVRSLTIATGADGRVLLYCFAGCVVDAIVAAMGLTVRDLFLTAGSTRGAGRAPRPPRPDRASERTADAPMPDLDMPDEPSAGLTLATYAAAKRLPPEFLRACGLSDIHVGRPCVRVPYYDAGGAEVAVRFRCALDGPDRFRWRRGAMP